MFIDEIKSIPQVTRYFLALALVLFVFELLWDVAHSDHSPSPVALVAGNWSYLWAYFTSTFVEPNIISLLINSVYFFAASKYIENIWGGLELAKFIAIVSVCSNFSVLIAMIVTYAYTGDIAYIYETEIRGMVPILMGYLVVFKQVVPEHRVKIFRGVATFRVKNAPMISLAVLSVIYLVIFREAIPFYLSLAGFLYSWIYLRFFKLDGALRGDRSEEFAFVSFFPDRVRPFIQPMTHIIHSFMKSFRLIPNHNANQTNTTENTVLPVSAKPNASELLFQDSAKDFDSARRKQLAMKEVEGRLESSKVVDN